MMTRVAAIAGVVLLALAGLAEAKGAVSAACSYRKSFHRGGYDIHVVSRPVDGCGVQVVDIQVMKGKKPFARFKSDADMQVEQAWFTDLDGNGTPELVAVSRSQGSGSYGAVEVYYLDGNVLKRTSQPNLEDRSGYQGHDAFRLEGRQIVRTFPVYTATDSNAEPTGGSRTVRYEYRAGALGVVDSSQAEAPAPEAATMAPVARRSSEDGGRVIVVDRTGTADTASPPSAGSRKPQALPAAGGKPVVTAVTTGYNYIEIHAGGRVEKFRTLKLDKPARLAIDIPGGKNGMTAKTVAVDRHGIAKARVGVNQGFVRIVLDSAADAPLPGFTVVPSDNGLKVEF